MDGVTGANDQFEKVGIAACLEHYIRPMGGAAWCHCNLLCPTSAPIHLRRCDKALAYARLHLYIVPETIRGNNHRPLYLLQLILKVSAALGAQSRLSQC